MDTERKIYGLLETVEQQQKSLKIAAAALEATRAGVADSSMRSIRPRLRGERRRRPGGRELVAEAAGPTIAELKQATASVAGSNRLCVGRRPGSPGSTSRSSPRAVRFGACRLDCCFLAAPRARRASRSKGRARGANRAPAERPWMSSRKRAGRSNSMCAATTNANASRSISAWGPSARRARIT